jgi:MoaA/NifB/PqqE/SkfB family radical SAM enzyme
MKLSTILQIIKINLIIMIKKIFRSSNIKPYKILINLTDLCNSRCTFCDIWKIKPQNEIDLENIKNSLNGIEQDIYWISFSGGEVTLVKYFYELIDYLKENFKNLKIIAFTTNALVPTRALEYAKYCKDNGFDTLITISLDGDKETHDRIRGVNGNYEKCLKLYKNLRENDILTNYGITVSETNADLIINNFCNLPSPIKAVTFVHSEGIYNKVNKYNEDIKIIKALEVIYKNYKLTKLYELIEKIHIKMSINFLKNQRKKNIIPCDVLNTSIHIMPNGDLKPCMFMDKCGNIKENNISEIMKSSQIMNAKKIIKENNCPKCWMNCYSPHSIMQNPIKSIFKFIF